MANKPVVLFTDTPADLGAELEARYSVHTIPLHVNLEGKDYKDAVDITADEIFEVYREKKILPMTSAINAAEYMDAFKPWLEKGYEVVCICIGGALSSCYQNACIAADELPGVYPVDSCNLSTGIGLLVIRAAELIAEGKSAAEVQATVRELTAKSHASFVIDTLEFMKAGGRCSSVAAFAASLLNIKPCIRVNNADGSMAVCRKYRGKLMSVLEKYVEEELASYPPEAIDTSRIFITHSKIDKEYCDMVREKINSIMHFDEIFDTDASCTISSHCGPGTLGILFMTK